MAESPMTGFHERLKTARKNKGITQEQLANSLGVSHATIQNYERGITLPRGGTLKKLPEILGCDSFWLLGLGTPLSGSPSLQELGKGLPGPWQDLSRGLEPFNNLNRQLKEFAGNLNEGREGLIELKARYEACPPLDAPDEYTYLPLVRVQASAGGGLSLEDYTDDDVGCVAFRRDWLIYRGKPKNFKLMEVKGDSMEPLICDGDLVLLDFSRTDQRPGKIFAVAFDGHIYLKRLYVAPGRLILRSENKVHADVVVDILQEEQRDNVAIIGQAISWFHVERS